MNDPRVWLLAIVPLIWFGAWFGGLHLAARMGGWSKLATAYRTNNAFNGFRFRFASGEMRGGPFLGLPCNYTFSLTLGSSPAGLYLATLLLIRPGHPPLFIPWRD